MPIRKGSAQKGLFSIPTIAGRHSPADCQNPRQQPCVRIAHSFDNLLILGAHTWFEVIRVHTWESSIPLVFFKFLKKTPLTNGIIWQYRSITTFRWFNWFWSSSKPNTHVWAPCVGFLQKTFPAGLRLKGANRRFATECGWASCEHDAVMREVTKSPDRGKRSLPIEEPLGSDHRVKRGDKAQAALAAVRTTTINFVGHPVGVIFDRMQSGRQFMVGVTFPETSNPGRRTGCTWSACHTPFGGHAYEIHVFKHVDRHHEHNQSHAIGEQLHSIVMATER